MTKGEDNNGFLSKDCISGNIVKYGPDLDILHSLPGTERDNLPYSGPGLVDLQINGVNGVDFNSASLNEKELISAAGYLLSRGVTTFYPTVITNRAGNIRHILSVINNACLASPLLNQCIGGIHLEGPFISKSDGYRGAHERSLVRAPDWNLFSSFQEASGNRIKIITLSPEWDNSYDFIERCRQQHLLVSIGHSDASSDQVDSAVRAGAILASHLGNGVPLMLERHPNILWDMLSRDELYTSIVADGFHLPDSFIRVVLKVKKQKAILVSDATCFSGLAPGIYKTLIGSEVLLEDNGRLSMVNGGGLLAGATKTLIENVQYMISKGFSDMSGSWSMASAGPGRLIDSRPDTVPGSRKKDMVVFDFKQGKILVREVYKNGKPV